MSAHESSKRSTAARWALAAAATGLLATSSLEVSAAALRVVQDPMTGELRAPTAAEADAFAKAEAQLRTTSRTSTAARASGPKEIHYADGTVETKLDEDSMMFSVVATRPDGSLQMECLPNAEAKTFVKSTAAKSSRKSSTPSATKVNHDHS